MHDPNTPPFVASASTAPRRWLRFPPVEDHHRESTVRLLREHSADVAANRALLLGAGRCEELPLADLAERFAEVTLVDVDRDAIAAARAMLPAEIAARVHLDSADITGTSAPLLEQAAAALASSSDAERAAQALAAAVDTIEPNDAFVPERSDLVIASVVMSQLASFALTCIAERCTRAFPEANPPLAAHPAVVEAVRRLSQRLETHFLARLPDWVAPDGRVFLSATVQCCYVHATGDGQWATDGWYRMTDAVDLSESLPAGLQIVHSERWPWLVGTPQPGQPPALLYNVQGFVLAPL